MAFGSMNESGDDAPMSEINVTPLVDVMLVLLIVFMITMPVLTHSIPIQLPTASANAEAKDEPKEPLRLAINAGGDYVLGEDKADLVELAQHLKQAKASNPDVIVAIAADKDVAYDAVAQALSVAKEAGITKVGFVTETRSQ